MGSSINAWIEYDAANHYVPERAHEAPFSEPVDDCIPLTDFDSLRDGKDYRFFAAISGHRKREDDPDLQFPLRGLPPNISGHLKRAANEIADPSDPNFGWLTFPEIRQALAHLSLTEDNLELQTNIVLDLMRAIDRRLGEGRSRLIFYIE